MSTEGHDYGSNPWRDAEILEELYHDRGLSQAGVADELGCSPKTVCTWMDKHDIPIKDARGKGDLTISDTPATFSHVQEGDHIYEAWTPGHKLIYVHRLVAVAEYGIDAVKGKVVHHKNEIPWDNCPDNLEPLTPAEHRKRHTNVE